MREKAAYDHVLHCQKYQPIKTGNSGQLRTAARVTNARHMTRPQMESFITN